MDLNRMEEKRLTVRTGISAGEQKDLFDYLFFPLLDSLQKPTDCVYQLICKTNKPVVEGTSKPVVSGSSKPAVVGKAKK